MGGSMNKRAYAPGVDFDQDVSGDRYFGTAQALIDAGVITAEQLPAISSVTFFKGEKVDGRSVKGAQFEHWMQVRAWGGRNNVKRFVVTKGVTREEHARRLDAWQQEMRPEAPTERRDPGPEAVAGMIKSASTAFNLGQEIYAGGELATVVGGYMLRRVGCGEGEFVSGGSSFNYQPGYTCKLRESGEVFFFAPHQLTDSAGRATHLRIVRNSAPAKERRAEPAIVESKAAAWPFPVVCGEPPQ